MESVMPSAGRVPRYYEDLGRAHDYLLRCNACQKLVTFETMTKLGCCDKCGTRRMIEITVLSEEEATQIRDGIIAFPDSDKFLEEFRNVE